MYVPGSTLHDSDIGMYSLPLQCDVHATVVVVVVVVVVDL